MKAVYKMTIGDECYIGQTFDYYRRIKNHINKLEKGTHENKKVQDKYNVCKSVGFEILFDGDVTREELCECEKKYIKEQQPSLNISTGGLGGASGVHKTPEQLEHLRIINLGKNNPMYGKPSHRRIPIIGRNADSGEEILFNSISEAAQYVNGDISTIAKVIRNNSCKIRYGYIWSRKPVSTIHESVE